MSIKNCTLKQNATSITVVGGTDLNFVEDGVEVKSGVHVHAPSVADFRVRPNITFKNRNPTLQADGQYTKGKREFSIAQPKLLASGKIVFNVYRGSIEVHPESTPAELDNLLFLGAQLPADTEVLDFMRVGTLG